MTTPAQLQVVRPVFQSVASVCDELAAFPDVAPAAANYFGQGIAGRVPHELDEDTRRRRASAQASPFPAVAAPGRDDRRARGDNPASPARAGRTSRRRKSSARTQTRKTCASPKDRKKTMRRIAAHPSGYLPSSTNRGFSHAGRHAKQNKKPCYSRVDDAPSLQCVVYLRENHAPVFPRNARVTS